MQGAASDPELWTFLDSGQQTRLNVFVRDLPEDYIDYIDVLLDYAPLRAAAEVRANRMTLKEFNAASFFVVPQALRERLISAYSKSVSFDEANAWGKVVQTNVGDFTKAEVKRLIEAAGKNDQIKGSFQLRHVLYALRKTKRYSDNDFNELLLENGLDEFIAAS